MKLSTLIYELLQLALRKSFNRGLRKGKRIGHYSFNFAVGPVTLKKGNTMPLALKLTTEQQVTVHITPVTPKGKTVSVENVQWSVVSGDATVTASDDGLSAVIASSENAGQSQVLVTADADLGEGVDTISDTIDVETAHQDATALGISADAPVLKP